MFTKEATDAYVQASKAGRAEVRELTAAGKRPNPLVLDSILEAFPGDAVQELGVVDIPAERIIGTKSAGRIAAFSASFHPLLGQDTEFARKWINLCADHLGDVGIREPILCYEYLGNFYVQEGNKRVSVLRHFGAPRIPGTVKRILPPKSDEPRIVAYYEFLEFYKYSKLYTIQFRRPGNYGRLLKYLGKKSGEEWTDGERKNFSAYYSYFREAFDSLKTRIKDVPPEEALLLWLQLYPYEDLGRLSASELKKTLEDLAGDMVTASREQAVKVETKTVANTKTSLLNWIITPDHIRVAFVHQLNQSNSAWVLGHEAGRKHLERVFGDRVTVSSYFDANDPAAADAKIRQAVEEGAQVVFTTAPILIRSTLKAAVKHPKVRFYNCSVNQPYASIRTYYGRIYEAKFITGAIAGAMAQNNRIGYIASNPIFGVPASINAFALGAQMTNPRAQIELSWSCCQGTSQASFFTDGIRVVSNRDVPTKDKMYLDFCNYGTYLLDDRGGLISLASPVWAWGKFYETVIRAFLAGAKPEAKETPSAVNYWLGMDSGVIDINLSDRLPAGVRSLARLMQQAMCYGQLDPFARRIIAQDGSVKNDGSRVLSPQERLQMDWLCENVIGEIPSFDQILPMSQNMVRELGIYRSKIPAEKEKSPHEDFDRIR